MIIINKIKNKTPKVSIITPTFNSGRFLDETLKSIQSQTYKNYELIIIDGKSTDKTLKIINKYKNIINYCISEKDKGIYDAFNKGMRAASGKYILVVNSDDKLMKNALQILNKYDLRYPDIDFIFGSVRKHWGVLHGYNEKKIKYSWGFYSSHSTGFCIKRKSAKKVGEYNIRYKYHADYDYFYRMIVHHKMKGVATKKHELFGIFRRGGFSSRASFKKKFYEEIKIRYDNKQNIFTILIIVTYKLFKNFKQLI
jgi:glycosyltransferase involved in cell wall biosynthesis